MHSTAPASRISSHSRENMEEIPARLYGSLLPQTEVEPLEGLSIFELAASYSYGLAKNHSFVDGNKRIAFTVAAIFLEINGFHFNAPESEVVVIFEHVSGNQSGLRLVTGAER
ncbi:MAG: hypothetical protein DSY94_02575 [SAR324 cluster bacterium]|uniref:Fido domain-containing protein n=1 Tax=SAR324 cluster bacterium TaxID=2024889 RepID=A0A432GR54_9DELT|nr:MAG: hypothetical protein DSY94_02575 [SAR324 cluster bacterium]